MYQSLFIGNKLVRLKEVNSTNVYLKKIITKNSKEIEGLVVFAKNQIEGKGQRGNIWKSESDKNLIFSIDKFHHFNFCSFIIVFSSKRYLKAW